MGIKLFRKKSEIEHVCDLYEAFDRASLKAAYEIGEQRMGFGGSGRINLEINKKLRLLMYRLTREIPIEELPEGILLTQPYTGSRLGVVVPGGFGIDLTPSRNADYFLPKTYERYIVDPGLGEEFIPGSGQFVGPDEVSKKNVLGAHNLFSLKPYLSREQFGWGMEEVNPLEISKIEKIVAGYKSSITSDKGKLVLAEFERGITELNNTREALIVETAALRAPIIAEHLKVLLNTVRDFGIVIPKLLPIERMYEKDQERMFLLFQENKVRIVVSSLNKLGVSDLQNTRNATDFEFLQNTHMFVKYQLFDRLPKRIRKQINDRH